MSHPGPGPVPCPTLYAELPQVSASITVNLPCQPGVPGPGQRLPHAIREDLRSAPEEPEWALTNPRWDPAAAAAPPRPPPLHGTCTSGLRDLVHAAAALRHARGAAKQ